MGGYSSACLLYGFPMPPKVKLNIEKKYYKECSRVEEDGKTVILDWEVQSKLREEFDKAEEELGVHIEYIGYSEDSDIFVSVPNGSISVSTKISPSALRIGNKLGAVEGKQNLEKFMERYNITDVEIDWYLTATYDV